MQQLARRAFIGFAASVASDTISNSLRVVKTYRQVHEGDVGYCELLVPSFVFIGPGGGAVDGAMRYTVDEGEERHV